MSNRLHTSERVYWSSQERNILIEEVAERQLDVPGMSLRDALRDAQKLLPEHRQRNIDKVHTGGMRWLIEGVGAAKIRITQQRKKTVEPPPAPPPQPAPSAPAEERIYELLRDVAIRLAREVLSDPVVASLLREEKHSKAEPTTIKGEQALKPRRRVLIAGLLNGQVEEIRKGFGDEVDLRFWTKDETVQTLKSRLGSSDHAVVMVDFVDHSVSIATRASGVPTTSLHGGMTRLREELRRFVRV